MSNSSRVGLTTSKAMFAVHCLDGSGRRPCAAPTGRTHDRNRTARRIFSSLFLHPVFLHPAGRPLMRWIAASLHALQ